MDLVPLFHEILDQKEKLEIINDFAEDGDSALGSKYNNFHTNPRVHESSSKIALDLRSSHIEDNDERETGAQTSEEDDELCISMILKNDPKLTVN